MVAITELFTRSCGSAVDIVVDFCTPVKDSTHDQKVWGPTATIFFFFFVPRGKKKKQEQRHATKT